LWKNHLILNKVGTKITPVLVNMTSNIWSSNSYSGLHEVHLFSLKLNRAFIWKANKRYIFRRNIGGNLVSCSGMKYGFEARYSHFFLPLNFAISAVFKKDFLSSKILWGVLTRASVRMVHLTFWRNNYFFLILAHPVYKTWIIQEPNTLKLWNKLHFEGKKNGEYIPCLKYSVPIFAE